jgi:hypothetical protein
MTLGSKGSKKATAAHRTRMPWMVAREGVAGMVLNAKDKAILDGCKLIETEDIDRMSQVDPLDALKTAVKTYEYNTSTGKNIFQLASQLPHHGRGQKFYRKEWTEGTYEKHVTLSSIEFSRDGREGTAFGYMTFHGESTLRPIAVAHSAVAGWHVEYDAKCAVPYDSVVAPPPSIGTDVPVNPATYRLRAYPYYDAPNPEAFVEKLLKDRGVLPDPEVDPNAALSTPSLGDEGNDGSVHVKA